MTRSESALPCPNIIVSAKTDGDRLVALLFLSGLTAGIAFVDLGPLNTIVALVIATVKALLVVLIFMHVKYTSEKLIKMVMSPRSSFSGAARPEHDGLRHPAAAVVPAAGRCGGTPICDILRRLRKCVFGGDAMAFCNSCGTTLNPEPSSATSAAPRLPAPWLRPSLLLPPLPLPAKGGNTLKIVLIVVAVLIGSWDSGNRDGLLLGYRLAKPARDSCRDPRWESESRDADRAVESVHRPRRRGPQPRH